MNAPTKYRYRIKVVPTTTSRLDAGVYVENNSVMDEPFNETNWYMEGPHVEDWSHSGEDGWVDYGRLVPTRFETGDDAKVYINQKLASYARQKEEYNKWVADAPARKFAELRQQSAVEDRAREMREKNYDGEVFE